MAYDDHTINHFVLHTQHIFTMAALITITFVFANFSYHPTATIPLSYRQELLGVSSASFAIVTISAVYDNFFGQGREDPLYSRKVQHILVFFFSLTALIFTAVFLNQGNIKPEEITAFAVASGILAFLTLISFFYHFGQTLEETKKRNIS